MAGEEPKTTAYGTPIPTTGRTIPKFKKKKRQAQKPKETKRQAQKEEEKEIPAGFVYAPGVTQGTSKSKNKGGSQYKKPTEFEETTQETPSGKITFKTPKKKSTAPSQSVGGGGYTDSEALAYQTQLQYSATTGGTQTTVVTEATHGSREGYYIELHKDLKESPSAPDLEAQLQRAIESNRGKYSDAGVYRVGKGKYFIFEKEPDPHYVVTVTPGEKESKKETTSGIFTLVPPDSVQEEYGPTAHDPKDTMQQLAPYLPSLDTGAGVIPYVVEEPGKAKFVSMIPVTTEGGDTVSMPVGEFKEKLMSGEITVYGDPLSEAMGASSFPVGHAPVEKEWAPESPMKEFYSTDYAKDWIENPLRQFENQTGLYFKGTPVGDVRPISATLGYVGETVEKGIIKPVVAGGSVMGGVSMSLYSRVRYGKGLDETLSWETRKKMLADIHYSQDALLTLPFTGMSLSLLTGTNILPNTKWSLARSPIPTTMAGTAPTQAIGKIVSHKKVLGGIEVTHSGGLKGFIPKGHPSYAQYTFSSQMKGLAMASVKNVMQATQTGTRYGLFLGGLEYISSEGDMERTKRGFTAGATLGVLAVTYGAVSPSLKKFGSWQPPSMTNIANQKYTEIKSKAGSLLMVSKSPPTALKSVPASSPIINQVILIDALRPSQLKMSNIPQEKESSKTIGTAPIQISSLSPSTVSPTTATNIDRILKTKVKLKVGTQQTQKQKQKNKQERKIGLLQLQAQGVQTPTKTKQRVTPIPILGLVQKQKLVTSIPPTIRIAIGTQTKLKPPKQPPFIPPPITLTFPDLKGRKKPRKRQARKGVKRRTKYEPTVAGVFLGKIETKVKARYTGLEIRGRKKRKKKGDFDSIF